MTLTLDPRSGLSSIPAWLLVIGFIGSSLVLATQTFALTATQSEAILFVVGVLTLLATLLTTAEKEAPTE